MVLNIRSVALTGASGVLGRHLDHALSHRGITIVRLGRAEWDLRQWPEPDNLDVLIGDVDAVFHIGALTPSPHASLSAQDIMDANVRACAALGLWAAARRTPLVYAGSAGIYAPGNGPATEDAALAVAPLGGFYGQSKFLGEQVLTGLAAQRGLHLCVLRLTSLYGNGMNGEKRVAAWLAAAKEGKTITVAPPVSDAFNFLQAADAARAALLALDARAWGTFNIAGPDMTTIEDLAHACVRIAGRGAVEIEAMPEPRPPERHFDVSCARAAETFGYVPGFALDEGLRLMLEHRYGR